MNSITEDSPKQLKEADVPEKKEQEPSDTETVITVTAPEADTLNIQDLSNVDVHIYSVEELTRLFRSLVVLTPLQKRILEVRYLSIIIDYEKRIKYIDCCHHFTRITVSLGSVGVPALLSIQSPNSNSNSRELYWITWLLSLLVTVCHNFNTIFRFDKKFFGVHSTLEKLKSEGWQYLELSGHYSGHHGHASPTHLNQYVYFVNSIERIKLKQVEEEYNSLKETDKPPNPLNKNPDTGNSKLNSELTVPSPLDLTMNRGKKTEI